MKMRTPLFLLALILGFAHSSHAFRTIRTAANTDLALSGYDAVIYYAEKKAVKGYSTYKYRWMDAEWHFANATNLALFKMHPEMFVPPFGGHCTYGIANGVVGDDFDPQNFVVHEGRLYFFHDKKLIKAWKEDKEAFIQEAEKNWEKLIAQNRISTHSEEAQ